MRNLAASGVLLCLLLPGALEAQRVLGRIVEEGSGAPVATAFVALLDDEGRRRAAGLSGDGGLFTLEAPDPGVYRIRVDRIGYRSTITEPFAVGPEGGGPLTIGVSGAAIALDPIEVEGARRCILRPEEGEATFVLWSEARKALEITDWAGREERFVFDLLQFRRLLRRTDLVVDTETVEALEVAASQPFYADSADRLLRDGFVQVSRSEHAFFGPDAALLMSDAFLETHCFRRVPGDSAGLVGLAFEPVDGDARGEIEGVLWLDRATAHLRFLEFRYVNAPLPRRVDPRKYGGIVRFHRMRDESWIVSHWRIRSPVFARRVRGLTHEGYSETEGDVLRVRTSTGETVPYTRAAGLLLGRVLHRRTGEPAGGVRVRIVGTPYESTTDPLGRFGFEGLPEGRYRVEAEGAGIRQIETTVHIERGARREIVLSG